MDKSLKTLGIKKYNLSFIHISNFIIFIEKHVKKNINMNSTLNSHLFPLKNVDIFYLCLVHN